MKKLILILALLAIMLGWANDRLKHRNISDSDMKKVVEDMNKKMPMVFDVVQVENAQYENRTVIFTGTIVQGQIVDEDWNKKTRDRMVSYYCSSKNLVKSKINFAYSYDQVALRGFNDKLKRENFSGEVSAASCAR